MGAGGARMTFRTPDETRFAVALEASIHVFIIFNSFQICKLAE
jgi:hypothetical protein